MHSVVLLLKSRSTAHNIPFLLLRMVATHMISLGRKFCTETTYQYMEDAKPGEGVQFVCSIGARLGFRAVRSARKMTHCMYVCSSRSSFDATVLKQSMRVPIRRRRSLQVEKMRAFIITLLKRKRARSTDWVMILVVALCKSLSPLQS